MKQWIAVACVFVLGTGLILAEKKTLNVTLKPVEGKNPPVMFNPTELTINKSVPWQKSKSSEQGEGPVLEFASSDSAIITFETAFDTTATDESVYRKYIVPLENLTNVDDELKRPPMVKVIWGPGANSTSLPDFQGVIESMSSRYTMFLPSGMPVRATCTIRIKEASRASFKGADEDPCPE
jgi:hypothetical protein